MASLNKAVLIGYLTADPAVKKTQSDISVASFTIAVNRNFRGKNAQDGQPTADFINIVAWRQTADFVSKYFKKGSAILVCGSIQTRNYTDNNGNKRYVTEVVADEVGFVGNKESGTADADESYNRKPAKKNTVKQEKPTDEDDVVINEDDLPF